MNITCISWIELRQGELWEGLHSEISYITSVWQSNLPLILTPTVRIPRFLLPAWSMLHKSQRTHRLWVLELWGWSPPFSLDGIIFHFLPSINFAALPCTTCLSGQFLDCDFRHKPDMTPKCLVTVPSISLKKKIDTSLCRNNTPLCICSTFSESIHQLWGIWLFPKLGYCESWCNKHECANVFVLSCIAFL
jgi:hypothetical protein